LKYKLLINRVELVSKINKDNLMQGIQLSDCDKISDQLKQNDRHLRDFDRRNGVDIEDSDEIGILDDLKIDEKIFSSYEVPPSPVSVQNFNIRLGGDQIINQNQEYIIKQPSLRKSVEIKNSSPLLYKSVSVAPSNIACDCEEAILIVDDTEYNLLPLIYYIG
jgi:hypothetical protein